jgi:hypothetical protein
VCRGAINRNPIADPLTGDSTMAMVCPQCGSTNEQQLLCPECGVRLVFHDLSRSQAVASWKRSRWMFTPVGRVVVGVLLAQGLFYALRHLFTGILMMLDGEDASSQAWTTFHGLLFLQALQVLVPAFGGVLAGAGHRGCCRLYSALWADGWVARSGRRFSPLIFFGVRRNPASPNSGFRFSRAP